MNIRNLYLLLLILVAPLSYSAVVPEDRADILYGRYEGPDSTFTVPSILVRKQYKERISGWISHVADYNSTASIDVVTQGSAFKEVRNETSGGIDFLNNKTLLSVNYKNSTENDYVGRNWGIGLSQDFFGDLSTLTMGYSRGEDDVYQNIRDGQGADDITGRTFRGNAYHERFSVGWSQILTRNWLVSVIGEASIDEGRLANSYRQVRYNPNPNGAEVTSAPAPEVYPDTRSSLAYAAKSMYYLPWRAALKVEGRVFNDSWDINAFNYEIKYTHPVGDNLILDFRYRYYDQTKAYFFYDFLDFEGQYDEYTRDKEMASMTNTTIGFGVSYNLKKDWAPWFEKTTVNFYFDYISYEFVEFLDARQSDARFTTNPVDPGQEDPFSYEAMVPRIFVSFWY